MKNPFHLAIPVNDLAKAVDFYENILGCDRGRESDSWIDFNLFGRDMMILGCVLLETKFDKNGNKKSIATSWLALLRSCQNKR